MAIQSMQADARPTAPPMPAKTARFEDHMNTIPQQPIKPNGAVTLDMGEKGAFDLPRRHRRCTTRTICIVAVVIIILALGLGLGLGLGLKHKSAGGSDASGSSTSSPSDSGNCCTVKCGTIGRSSSGQKCCGPAKTGQAGIHFYCSPALELAGCDTNC